MKIEGEPRNRIGSISGERGTFLLFGRTFLQKYVEFLGRVYDSYKCNANYNSANRIC